MTVDEDKLQQIKKLNESLDSFMETDYEDNIDQYGDITRILNSAYSLNQINTYAKNSLIDYYNEFENLYFPRVKKVDPRLFFYTEYCNNLVFYLAIGLSKDLLNNAQFEKYNRPDLYDDKQIELIINGLQEGLDVSK